MNTTELMRICRDVHDVGDVLYKRGAKALASFCFKAEATLRASTDEIESLHRELTAAREIERTCEWTLDANEYAEIYESACGEAWSFFDGDCTANRVVFCHGCGGKVRERRLDDENTGDE